MKRWFTLGRVVLGSVLLVLAILAGTILLSWLTCHPTAHRILVSALPKETRYLVFGKEQQGRYAALPRASVGDLGLLRERKPDGGPHDSGWNPEAITGGYAFARDVAYGEKIAILIRDDHCRWKSCILTLPGQDSADRSAGAGGNGGDEFRVKWDASSARDADDAMLDAFGMLFGRRQVAWDLRARLRKVLGDGMSYRKGYEEIQQSLVCLEKEMTEDGKDKDVRERIEVLPVLLDQAADRLYSSSGGPPPDSPDRILIDALFADWRSLDDAFAGGNRELAAKCAGEARLRIEAFLQQRKGSK